MNKPIITTLFTACAVSAALIACSGNNDNASPPPAASTPTPPPSPTPSGEPTLTRTVFMSGLSEPWDLAFLSDGTLFFSEKCRGLSVRRTNGTVTRLFGTTGSALVAPDFFCEGQSGAHGVAVDPDFSNNRYVYLFMPSNLRTNPRTNRVVRLTVNADFTSVSDRTDIVTDMAFKDQGNAVSNSSGAHSGGRMRFGPDGYLYVTTGDNHNATLPQDLTRLGSKVLRITRDGAAAPGNNTPAGGDARIYTYGHRNPQGIAFRPGTGQPFTAEHGPNHSDEVTPLVAGGNAGWDPKDRPSLSCPDNYCGYAGTPTTMPMTDTARFPQALRPSWVYDGPSRGIGPLEFLSGNQWKDWNGRIVVSIMGPRQVHVLQLNAAGMTTGSKLIDLPNQRVRALVQGPDGALYAGTDSGEVWKITAN